MKKVILGFAVLLITFTLGRTVASIASETLSNLENKIPEEVRAVEIESLQVPVLLSDHPDAEFDPNIDYAKSLKVKLLKTGDFHADEVPYRSGEKWLGLFRVGDSYQLLQTTIRKTPSKETGLYDTNVSTSTKGDAVFLIRGATDLHPGSVDTVFDSRSDENFGYFNDSQPKGFGLRGTFWKLRAENLNLTGSPGEGTLLVLEREGFESQVLRYLRNGCDDCGWSVEWVGDLNRDGRLDFLIDLSGHYNSSEPTLFLSTHPSSNKMVRIIAGFHVVGC